MRRIFNFLLTSLILLMTGFVLSSFSPVPESFIQPLFDNFTSFLTKNWAVLALVISEVSALLPGKFSGILQTIVVIGNIIFKIKSNNTKSKKS